jgi:hypothetical protein
VSTRRHGFPAIETGQVHAHYYQPNDTPGEKHRRRSPGQRDCRRALRPYHDRGFSGIIPVFLKLDVRIVRISTSPEFRSVTVAAPGIERLDESVAAGPPREVFDFSAATAAWRRVALSS